MRIHRVLYFVLTLVVLVSDDLSAQKGTAWSHAHRTFSFSDENDALPGGSSDSAYTQGLRAEWQFFVWNPNWNSSVKHLSFLSTVEMLLRRRRDSLWDMNSVRGACTPRTPESQLPCGTAGFSIGQTEYTPSDLTVTALQPKSRPYVGYLFGAFTRTV